MSGTPYPPQKKAYILADNKLALNAGWDNEMLKLELEDLKLDGVDLELTGFDIGEIDDILGGEEDLDNSNNSNDNNVVSLQEKFIIPPLSIFDTRLGYWQDRKRKWLDIGIKSEQGRDEDLTYAVSCQSPDIYAKKNAYEDKIGHKVTMQEFAEANPEVKLMTGTSIFDPVLCEVVYKWFSSENAQILDPFAGGSVRGVVASYINRKYTGFELRAEQVDANREQGNTLCANALYKPTWINDDSCNIDKYSIDADLVFSCPPYADLEVYSDNPADLSNMPYPDFIKAYRKIIKNACDKLKNDRFACFVISEVRSKKGDYYNFVHDTIDAFLDAGCSYYNECILINAIASKAMACGRLFNTNRKIARVHQNILVFVKGDAKKATEYCGLVDVEDISSLEEQ